MTFEQRFELLAPTGEVLLLQDAEFAFLKATHNQIGQVFGFPVPSAGDSKPDYTLRLSLRRAGDAEFKPVADFPFQVNVMALSSANARH